MTLEKRVCVITISVVFELLGEKLCYYVSIFGVVNCCKAWSVQCQELMIVVTIQCGKSNRLYVLDLISMQRYNVPN